MKPYIPIVSPGFIRLVEKLSPLEAVSAATVAPFIVSKNPMDTETEIHERTHIIQQYECGFVMLLITVPMLLLFGAPWWLFPVTVLLGFMPIVGGFYLVYWGQWLYWFLRARKIPVPGMTAGEMAYYLIAFEREARVAESTPNYLRGRAWFAWVHITELERGTQTQSYPKKLYNWLNGL